MIRPARRVRSSESIARRVVSPVTRWWGRALRAAPIPRPETTDRVHADGVGVDRLLVTGSGAAAGWGVLSHDLALAGGLARALAARSGQGVDVDVAVAPDLRVRDVPAALGSLHIADYDAFVVGLGVSEVFAFETVAEFERGLVATIDAVRAGASVRSRIVVLGIPPLRLFGDLRSLIARFAARRSNDLNRAAAGVCRATPGVTFIEMPPAPRSRGDFPDRGVYAAWGDAVAATLAPLMFRDRLARPSATPSLDERRRLVAIDALGLSPDDCDPRFARAVALAARLLGAPFAAFVVVGESEVWFRESSGVPRQVTPRPDAPCSVTIAGRGGLIVGDARADARFSSSPLVTGRAGLRFYAGYPVLAPHGEPVGALCVFDTRPRSPEDVDLGLLRRLASMIERQLALPAVAGGVRRG